VNIHWWKFDSCHCLEFESEWWGILTIPKSTNIPSNAPHLPVPAHLRPPVPCTLNYPNRVIPNWLSIHSNIIGPINKKSTCRVAVTLYFGSFLQTNGSKSNIQTELDSHGIPSNRCPASQNGTACMVEGFPIPHTPQTLCHPERGASARLRGHRWSRSSCNVNPRKQQ
jgi:hypothetical protein